MSKFVIHFTASVETCTRSIVLPWNFLRGHSKVMCFTVCLASPQSQDGDSRIPHLWSESPLLPLPVLILFSETHVDRGRWKPLGGAESRIWWYSGGAWFNHSFFQVTLGSSVVFLAKMMGGWRDFRRPNLLFRSVCIGSSWLAFIMENVLMRALWRRTVGGSILLRAGSQ